MPRMPKKRRNKPPVQRTSISLPRALYNEVSKDDRLLNEVFVEAVQHWVEAEKLIRTNQAAEKIREIWIKLVKGFKNPYQVLAANWRAMRTLDQVDSISSGRLKLDALPVNIYLMRVIEEMMAFLASDDVYWTVTNLRFWRGTGEEPQGDNVTMYLRAQEAAAVRRMRLRRVFLIVKEDVENAMECLRAEVARQRDFHKRLAEKIQDEKTLVKTHFVELVHLDRQSAIDRYGHFGLIRRLPSGENEEHDDRGCVVIQPYSERGIIKNLEVLFSDGPGRQDFKTRPYLSQFEEAMAQSIPLQEFACKYDVK